MSLLGYLRRRFWPPPLPTITEQEAQRQTRVGWELAHIESVSALSAPMDTGDGDE